jgi:hypothetical protein
MSSKKKKVAPKQKVAGRSVKNKALQTVRKLTVRAQRELAGLVGLVDPQAGALDRAKLDTGLKKLQKSLDKICVHEFRI